jgi:hypothetical protein
MAGKIVEARVATKKDIILLLSSLLNRFRQ